MSCQLFYEINLVLSNPAIAYCIDVQTQQMATVPFHCLLFDSTRKRLPP